MLCNLIPTYREKNTTLLKKIYGGNKLYMDVQHITQSFRN